MSDNTNNSVPDNDGEPDGAIGDGTVVMYPGAVQVAIPPALPRLVVAKSDLPAAVHEIRDLFIADGTLFDRGRSLVRVQQDATKESFTHALTVPNVVMEVHRVCRPMQPTKDGPVPVTVSDRVARMYLEDGAWGLQPLAGITTAPLLRDDGAIVTAHGYDEVSQLWCDAPPAVAVPERPTKADAKAALLKLRETFCTFPFADSDMVTRGALKVVDLGKPPGSAESSFLNALLTGVARPSLWLAPGVAIIAPKGSGAGSGKGLLARSIATIAFGLQPQAFAAGDAKEFDKRVGSALMEGRPVVLIDNINDRLLRSETLASVITERPSGVRVLGYSQMVTLNSAALVMLTGNGLIIGEDHVRRLVQVPIDPRHEDPETRLFPDGFLDSLAQRRVELLEAALTILRWGRQNADQLQRGRPLGSFETWCRWVRDPLLTLGCADPVLEMLKAKQRDPQRRELTELFVKWHECHSSDWVTVAELHDDVIKLLDPEKKKESRQFAARAVERHVDTRIAGFVLTRKKTSKRAAAQYQLLAVEADGEADNAERARDNEAPASPDEVSSTGDAATDDTQRCQAPPRHRNVVSLWKDPAYRRMREAALSRRLAEYEAEDRGDNNEADDMPDWREPDPR